MFANTFDSEQSSYVATLLLRVSSNEATFSAIKRSEATESKVIDDNSSSSRKKPIFSRCLTGVRAMSPL